MHSQIECIEHSAVFGNRRFRSCNPEVDEPFAFEVIEKIRVEQNRKLDKSVPIEMIFF